MINNRVMLWATALACALELSAKVTLPQLFQNGMVVQRGKAIPVWGQATAGQQVTVTLNKQQASATTDAEGRWRADLPAMKAGGPYTLEVRANGSGDDTVTIGDVMVGDVWLLSGQSNIDVTVERVYPWYTTDIDSYENPQIRLFRVQNETDTHSPRTDIRPTGINWKPVNKQNAWLFSAVGYFLGRRMYEKSGVAQGVIVNSWGGTPIEAWVAADSMRQDFPQLLDKLYLYQNDDYVRAQQQANNLVSQQWSQLLDKKDPGKQQDFTAPEYDDSHWAEVNQYQNDWAKAGGRDIIGSIWLRQHVTIDKAHAGKPARLLLGTLFDADYTYVNGHEVGRTYYQYPPRRYDLPAGLLREGDNVITVRFVNKYGTAHFINEKPYFIAFGDDRQSLNPLPKDIIPLSQTWLHHAGAQMPSCPSGDVSLQNQPTTLYNAVVHPLAPYALAGVVWYQGESNTGSPQPYERLLTKLITGWRQLWQQPELPFVVVQLANYMEPSEQPQNTGWSQVREAQRRVAQRLPHVELATAIDLGETVDIHPLRKREVADRIGLCMDRLAYHNNKVKMMPRVASSNFGGQTVTLTFDQPLRQQETLYEWEVAGADGKFYNATAHTQGNSVVITSPVANPCRVRHAWKNNPLRLNTYAASGLPVGPFELELLPMR